jgi:putative inorganic carbon (HCO3(-)) transporter
VSRERVVRIAGIVAQAGFIGFVAASVISIAAEQACLTIALLAWGLKMLLERRWEVKRTPLDWAFLILAAVMILSTAFSIKPMEGVRLGLKKLLLIPIVYLTVNQVQSEKRLKEVVWLLLGVTGLVSLYGIIIYLGGLEERASATFSIYMTTGGILMMADLVAIALLLNLKRRRELAALGAIVVLVSACLAVTYTRSAWLGLVVGLLLMAILRHRKVLFLFLILAILIPFAPHGIKARAASIVDPKDPTNHERVLMWQAGWRMLKDRPVLGLGPIDMKEPYQKYKLPEAREVVGHLHNNFVQVAATMGSLGLLAFLYWIFAMLKSQVRSYRKVPGNERFMKGVVLGGLAAYTGFLVNGLFEWNFGDSEVIMLVWLFTGLALATERLLEEGSASLTNPPVNAVKAS